MGALGGGYGAVNNPTAAPTVKAPYSRTMGTTTAPVAKTTVKPQTINTLSYKAPAPVPHDTYQAVSSAGIVGGPPINGPVGGGTTSRATSSFSGGGGGGSLGEDASGGGAPAAPAVHIPTDDEFLAGDSAFQSQLDSLLKALTNYGSNVAKQRADYDTDYQVGLKGLGWKDHDNDLTNNVVKNAQGGYDAAADAGDWDWTDQNGAAGRGFTSQQNDFASRGLLQSTDYVKSQDDFKRSLMDQLNQTVSGRERYQQGLTDQYAAYKDDAGIDEKRNLLGTGQAQQARFDALARKAAQFS